MNLGCEEQGGTQCGHNLWHNLWHNRRKRFPTIFLG